MFITTEDAIRKGYPGDFLIKVRTNRMVPAHLTARGWVYLEEALEALYVGPKTPGLIPPGWVVPSTAKAIAKARGVSLNGVHRLGQLYWVADIPEVALHHVGTHQCLQCGAPVENGWLCDNCKDSTEDAHVDLP